MREELKKILKENSLEYYENALEAENKGDYNTSVTLFFKTIGSLADLYILIYEEKIPSNHAERFRLLENKHREIYSMLDRDFSFYQDSYKAKLNKETSRLLKNDAKKLFGILKINI